MSDGTQIHSPAIEPMKLGDFTASSRMIRLSFVAIAIGILSTFVALALLRLIDACTNLFYFHRLSSTPVSPADNNLGILVLRARTRQLQYQQRCQRILPWEYILPRGLRTAAIPGVESGRNRVA